MMNTVFLKRALVLGFLLTSICQSASGTTLLAHDLESLSLISDQICTGRVIDSTSFLKNSRIYTLSRVEVIDVVKGENHVGDIIEVVTAGGHSESFSQKVFGAAELEANREYLLFLERRGAPDIAYPVGMTQGALPILLDQTGTVREVHPPKAFPRLMKRDKVTGRLLSSKAWITEANPLDDILIRVKDYIGGER